MILYTTWFGTFLFEDDVETVSKLFPSNAKEIAGRMKTVASGGILEEEREMAQGQDRFLVVDPRLTKLGGELLEEEMPEIAPEEHGFSMEVLHEAMMILAEEKAGEGIERDESITQAVSALDDLTQTANLLSERLREWYGLHFPGQAGMMNDEDFISLVLGKGKGDETHADFKPISELARTLGEIHARQLTLEEHIKSEMESSAPNISHLVGPIIGARLIAKAGGLTRLARLPSGTIQMLGAEKAMFRHLKEGSKPPKHGIIFQQPLIHRAPYWQRGKIARALASKIAIAAKVDEHEGKYMGEELKKYVLDRIEEIKERYPSPPEKGRKKKKN
jgi:nucleolar protein 56